MLSPTIQEMPVVDDHVLYVLQLCPLEQDFSMILYVEHNKEIESVFPVE